MPREQQEEILKSIDVGELKHSWEWTARPQQLAATRSEAPVILYSGARGAGKSRTGAEWVRSKERSAVSPLVFALVGRTAADVRDVMIQGRSGLLSVYPPSEYPEYIPSRRRVEFKNGSIGICFSSEEPNQLRGPQAHYSWADELAAWSTKPDDSGLTAWDNVRIATRLGRNPQIFASTTPKRTALIRELYKKAKTPGNTEVSLFHSKTSDNVYLSQSYLETITGLYDGTRLSVQELEGILLDDVEGALWNMDLLDRQRVFEGPGNLPRRIVSVDPSVSERPNDECGILVMAATEESNPLKRRGYLLADHSGLMPPSVWTHKIVKLAREYDAVIVAEINQGGGLIKTAVANIDPEIKVQTVVARENKRARAEPAALVYDSGRMFHVDRFVELEEQLMSWTGEGNEASPDRLDALVHGVTALLLPAGRKISMGGVTIGNIRDRFNSGPTTPSSRRIPSRPNETYSRGLWLPQ